MTTTKRETEEVIGFLTKHGVGLELSVPLLFRKRNLNLNQIANEAGYSRQLLYFALRGDRTPPAQLRRALSKQLGADPWEINQSVMKTDAKRTSPEIDDRNRDGLSQGHSRNNG